MPDKVQLKREELVGDSVVLTDINPKTETAAVEDSETGNNLDLTLQKMWNAINNKLSRVVNSVNGRTGVVVLRPEDVGLSKVDNVSFSDIKQWVINKLIEEFGYKRLELFDSLDQVQVLVDQNDVVYRDKAFYAGRISSTDLRSCIGYIYYDEGKQKLNFQYKPINTVGYTDNSIIYNEKLNDNDKTGGGLGVHIWKYEEALELYNGASKEDSGLRIKKEKLAGDLYFFEGVYGNGESTDDSALLYFTNIPDDAPRVQIYIDDKYIGEYSLRMKDSTKKYKLKSGDMLFCFFKDYHDTWNDAYYEMKPGMDTNLMHNGRSIGRVIDAPTDTNPDSKYVIKFYQFDGTDSYSIENYDCDRFTEDSSAFMGRRHLEVKTAKGIHPIYSGDENKIVDISGLEAVSDHQLQKELVTNFAYGQRFTANFPSGPVQINYNENKDLKAGLFVNIDSSLCVQPSTYYGNDLPMVSNWKPVMTGDMPVGSKSGKEHNSGLDSTSSFIGINLNKGVSRADTTKPLSPTNPYKFSNLSGLRITPATDGLSKEYLGLSKSDKIDSGAHQIGDGMSGGLSVNVGSYLEISNDPYKDKSTEYYDGGKINVRLGAGLTGDNENRITIKTDPRETINRESYFIKQIHESYGLECVNGTLGIRTLEGPKGVQLLRGGSDDKWSILRRTASGNGGITVDRYGFLSIYELFNLKLVEQANPNYQCSYYPLGPQFRSASEAGMKFEPTGAWTKDRMITNLGDADIDPPVLKISVGGGLKLAESSEEYPQNSFVNMDNETGDAETEIIKGGSITASVFPDSRYIDGWVLDDHSTEAKVHGGVAVDKFGELALKSLFNLKIVDSSNSSPAFYYMPMGEDAMSVDQIDYKYSGSTTPERKYSDDEQLTWNPKTEVPNKTIKFGEGFKLTVDDNGNLTIGLDMGYIKAHI